MGLTSLLVPVSASLTQANQPSVGVRDVDHAVRALRPAVEKHGAESVKGTGSETDRAAAVLLHWCAPPPCAPGMGCVVCLRTS